MAVDNYNKTVWVDGSTTVTEDKLDNIEQGLKDNDNYIDELERTELQKSIFLVTSNSGANINTVLTHNLGTENVSLSAFIESTEAPGYWDIWYERGNDADSFYGTELKYKVLNENQIQFVMVTEQTDTRDVKVHVIGGNDELY